MILSSTVRKGLRRLVAAGLAAVATVTIAIAATPGFPFTEDFADDSLSGPATTADWGGGTLELRSLDSLTAMDFTRSRLDATGVDPTDSRDIALGDFDGDGDLDAVVGNAGNGSAGIVNQIYRNTGGVFGAPEQLGSDALATRGVTVGDLDNDGKLDIVAGNFQGPVVYYLNQGGGSFDNGVEISGFNDNTWRIALVDVDADSDLDIVEAIDGNSNFLYLNRLVENGGELGFSAPIRVTASEQFDTRALAIGDINNDGDQDIVTGDFRSANHMYAWFEGQFVAAGPVDDSASFDTFAVALADLDGDGWLDLVEGNSGAPTQIYFNARISSPPTFIAPRTLSDSNASHVTVSLLLRDFDRDGDIDIVEGNNGAWDADGVGELDPQPVRLFLNNGDGTFANGINFTPAEIQKIYGAAAGDIDGDGQLDFVTAHSQVNPGGPDALSSNAVYLNGGNPIGPNEQQLDSYAESREVNQGDASSGELSTAVLSVTEQGSAELANLQFYLSNDGLNFLPVTPGVPVAFPNSNAAQLFWKVEMLTASPNTGQLPVIDQIEIEANGRPVILSGGGSFAVDEGLPIPDRNFTIAGFFDDPDDHALTYQSTGLPADTGITIDPVTGFLSGVPSAADALASPINLTARAYDGAESSPSVAVEIVVDPAANRPPTANDDGPYPVDEGGSITGAFNVLDNDEDPEDDAAGLALTANLVDPPAHSSLFELRPDGTFDYTHNGTETASDSFTYRAVDSEGRESQIATVTISVTPVNDQPVITLNGDATIAILVGDTFTDPGATANDPEDGDISGDIVVGGDTVDTSTAGTYVITYNVTDSGGLAADEVTRTVNVTEEADNPPTITLNGNATINLTVGDSFTDPGATASDPEDGDLTADIVVGGDTVNTSAAGTYVITYNVTDSDGNAAPEVTRTVVVSEDTTPPPPPPSGGGGGGGSGAVELWQLATLLLLASAVMLRRRRWAAPTR